MANKKITDLTELTEAASDDYLEIVDTSANTSKKISLENLTGGLATSTHSHDHGNLTGLGDNDHPQYLLTTGKAADSDKLDGYDSTAFLLDNGWESYTPTWTAATTNPSIGNGTLVGRYVQIGKTCILVVGLVMGSTTTYGSGNWAFSLPKSAVNTPGINFYGVAHIRKGGAANYERIAQIAPSVSTTVISLFTDPTQGSNSINISATVPFTWGEGDSLGFQITYEIA